MLAGRLPEIFFNETIVAIGASATTEERRKYCSTWKLLVFAKNFPNNLIQGEADVICREDMEIRL